MGWTQNGRNPDTDGDWAGTGSKADFKSKVEVISPTGGLIPYDSKEDGIYNWDLVEPESKLKIKVNTDGKSDRAEVRLTYFDMDTFLRAYNNRMNNLTETELQKIEEGDTQVTEDLTMETIETVGFENLFISVWSDVITTADNGDGEIQLTFKKEWPKNTSYLQTAHYGYDNDMESSNWTKTFNFWKDIVLVVGETALIFTPLSPLGVALFVTQMGVMGANYIASGFGAATQNKYGDYFPTFGFNHSYMFFVGDPEQPPKDYVKSILDDENLDIIEKLNLLTQFYGIAKVGAIVGGAILVMGLLKR